MSKIWQIDAKLIKNNLINLKQIVFEVTEKCNLNCRYCGLSDLYNKDDLRNKKDLPFKKAQLIIDYLLCIWKENHIPDAAFQFVISFYGGEPLINATLIKKIINYAEKSEITDRQIRYAMTTNAMLLDKHIDFLAEKKILLLISLDGDEKAQSYRMDHSGNNSFNQVIRNVKLLQSKYPEYFRESVSFNSVLHNQNDVEPLLHFFKTHFDKVPKISPLRRSGICDDKKAEFLKMYQNKLQSLIKSPNCEAIETDYFLEMPKGYSLSQYLYNSSGNIFYYYNQLLLQKLVNNEIYTGTCTPFSKKLFVTADGKILPCERIDYNFEVGYIHDDFVELDYKHVAELHNNYLSKCARQCVFCAINKSCPQCLYHIDDIRNKLSHCPSFCTKEVADQEKEQMFSYLRQHPHYYEKVLNEVSFSI